MDKSREQFEAAIKQKFGDLIDQRVCKNSDGDYMAWDMQVAWWAWQASRSAVEIELPSELSLKRFACSDCIGAVLEAVENHVLAAGLKVKGG